MNKFIGKQAYQNTAAASPRIEDAHAAITVCLDTLLHNLKILKEMPSGASELSNKVSSKCLTAIYILQSSLDFEKGHAIAENAGAIVSTHNNKPIRYGKSDFSNPSLLVRKKDLKC